MGITALGTNIPNTSSIICFGSNITSVNAMGQNVWTKYVPPTDNNLYFVKDSSMKYSLVEAQDPNNICFISGNKIRIAASVVDNRTFATYFNYKLSSKGSYNALQFKIKITMSAQITQGTSDNTIIGVGVTTAPSGTIQGNTYWHMNYTNLQNKSLSFEFNSGFALENWSNFYIGICGSIVKTQDTIPTITVELIDVYLSQ